RSAIHLSDCCLDAVMNALLCVSQRNAIHLRTFAPRLAKIPWLRRLSAREACVRKSLDGSNYGVASRFRRRPSSPCFAVPQKFVLLPQKSADFSFRSFPALIL